MRNRHGSRPHRPVVIGAVLDRWPRNRGSLAAYEVDERQVSGAASVRTCPRSLGLSSMDKFLLVNRGECAMPEPYALIEYKFIQTRTMPPSRGRELV